MIACIEIAGEIGLKVLTYNFTVLRASEGYAARIGEGRTSVTSTMIES